MKSEKVENQKLKLLEKYLPASTKAKKNSSNSYNFKVRD